MKAGILYNSKSNAWVQTKLITIVINNESFQIWRNKHRWAKRSTL